MGRLLWGNQWRVCHARVKLTAVRFLPKLALAISIWLAVSVTAAWADTVQLTLTNGDQTIDLSLPANPTPDFVGPYFFTLNDVPFTLDGTTQLARIVNFFDGTSGGGIGICDYTNCPLVDLLGPQLFSGPLDSPTLLSGSYMLTDAGDSFIPGDFETVASVPEPASLVLLAAGALGVARRRK